MAQSDPTSTRPAKKPRVSRWRSTLASEWDSFSQNFTRENIISNVKTLAWTIPLTLLIWVYAEREQVSTRKDVSVPFELVSPDPNRMVSIRQDKNLLLELNGPQARIQEVTKQLSGGMSPQGLRLEIPTTYTPNREHEIRTLDLVQNQSIFTDNGLIVVSAQPPRLEVTIDEVVEREARVSRPPEAKNVEATFDPPVVKIRGPRSLITKAEQVPRQEEGPRLEVYADLPDDVLKSPGHHEIPDVAIRRPAALEDERVMFPSANRVRAVLDVRQSDKSTLIRSMTVSKDFAGQLEKYEVVDFRPVIQNVTVTGPPEIIDAIDKGTYEPQPKARVVITQQDVGEPKNKVLSYDLPEGVRVSDEDRKRTVLIKLVERSATGGPL